MRNICLFCIMFISCELGFAQSDSTADMFPLKLDKRWIFGFNYFSSGWGPVYRTHDTGMVEYVIADSVAEGDSVRWTISMVRDYYHTTYDGVERSSWVRDTFRFDLVELLDGNHELYAPIPGYFDILPLQQASAESSKFYRYQIVDSSGQISKIISLDYLTITVLCQKDSGIIQSIQVWNGPDVTVDSLTLRYFRKQDSVLLGVDHPNTIPLSPTLHQNYPNPFNPTTTIKYDVVERGVITLKVFDLLGKELRTLITGSVLPGTYEVEFDGSGLSSGVYFYSLHAGFRTQVKKLLLVR